jgi:hypothetical protein
LAAQGTNWLVGLLSALILGITFGLSYWLLFGCFQAVKGETLDEQSHILPNQGIFRSARNGLLFGCIGGCISVLILGLGVGLFWIMIAILVSIGHIYVNPVSFLTWLHYMLDVMLHYGPFVGLACGLLLGLLNGWLACLRHVILRWLLWRHQAIPWNYPRFLDYAADRILLRKVGGSYVFVHRLLLDYFTEME